MENQIKQLQTQVNALKIRAFDAEESLRGEREQTNSFFQQLVNALRVRGDENGNVTLESILERASKLVEAEEGSDEAPVVDADEVEIEEVK